MANLKRVDEIVAALVRRDEQMQEIADSFVNREDQVYVSARKLGQFLGYKNPDNFMGCVHRAQILAAHTGRSVEQNFLHPDLFDLPGGDDLWLTPWAAFASIIEADSSKPRVASAKSYFASLAEEEIAADEARLKERQLFKRNHKQLHASAEKAGVKGKDHALFDHHGYMGMYEMAIREVEELKGVPKGQTLIDCAGATELAANNLRMAMTKDALDGGQVKNKAAANKMHKQAGKIVREAVKKGTGVYPESLPLEDKTIDQLSREKKRELEAAKKGRVEGQLP